MFVAVMIVGLILAFVGGLMLLVQGFRESVLWGLGMLFVPFVSLFFVITHWDKSKTAFGLNVVGLVLMVGGLAMGGGLNASPPETEYLPVDTSAVEEPSGEDPYQPAAFTDEEIARARAAAGVTEDSGNYTTTTTETTGTEYNTLNGQVGGVGRAHEAVQAEEQQADGGGWKQVQDD